MRPWGEKTLKKSKQHNQVVLFEPCDKIHIGSLFESMFYNSRIFKDVALCVSGECASVPVWMSEDCASE